MPWIFIFFWLHKIKNKSKMAHRIIELNFSVGRLFKWYVGRKEKFNSSKRLSLGQVIFMRRFSVFFITLVMLVLFGSCGKQPQVITSVQVQTAQVQNDLWLSFYADLNLGAMTFPSISLPVIHPRTLESVGSVELGQAAGSKNYIKLSANMSALAELRATQGKLPNGNMIPLIANNPTITVNLPSNAKLYITLSETVTAIGVAVPIRQFDQIGQSVPGVNFFPVIGIGQVVATAGLFTSRNVGQNGIAVVADVSQLVSTQDIYSSQIVPLAQNQETLNQVQLDYSSQTPKENHVNRINKMIYDLNARKARLSLH